MTTKFPPRNCPVCHGGAKRVLFRQSLGTFSKGSLLAGFDLAVCVDCGAGYADDIPPQEAFDRYYAEMSKYEFSHRDGVQSETDLNRFRETAEFLVPHLQKGDRLLDIGCATGGMLAEFKRHGFLNLLGVDPSPTCARLTKEHHGIDAVTATFATLPQLGESADVIFLTGVLEHLREVDASLERVKSCLRAGGLLYIEVPDASCYDCHFSAPFQLLSWEHVNYFSPVSLGNLMARHGFSTVLQHRLVRPLSAQADEPAIRMLFRWDAAGQSAASFLRDEETEPALKRYIQQSRDLERQIHEKITSLVDAGTPLAVWGAGMHTMRLLEESELARAQIVCFIDSNANYQGKQLAGHPVLSPADFNDARAEILISSQMAEAEIFRLITEKLAWPNIVHRLYAK